MGKRLQFVTLVWLVLATSTEATDQTTQDTQQDWPVVIAQLRQQRDRMPGHAATRQQLAIAYNNYAVALANQGRFEDATQQIEEAIRLNPSNTEFLNNRITILLNTAHAAYQTNQIREAKHTIEQVLAIDPDVAGAYALLGEIEYNSQRLKEAKAAWEKAVSLDPSLEQVNEKLEQLTQELPVETQFERLSQAYFDIRYPEQLDRDTGFDVRDALLRARREVGADFSFWPTRKLVVLVYSAEQFRQLRQDTPDWVAGQYDGKIRVPLPSRDLSREDVTRTLFHEYTHAIVHELTQNRCPTWFNEGLAEYEAWKDQQPTWHLLRQALAEDRVIPWANLSAQFSIALPAKEVTLAYQHAHSIVQYLAERHGFWRIRRLLKAVASGTSLEDALSKEFHLKLSRLEANWRKWLEETLGT